MERKVERKIERQKSLLVWDCPQCHSQNDVVNRFCKNCRYPEVVLEAKQKETQEEEQRQEEEFARTRRDREERWGCHVCTYHNLLSSTECEVCLTPRRKVSEQIKPKEPEVQGDPWKCPRCTFENKWYSKICKICEYNQEFATSYESEVVDEEVVKATQDDGEWIQDLAAQSVFGSHVISSEIVFQVWAPNAVQVYVAGPFNNWKQDPSFELKRDTNPKRTSYFVGSFTGIKPDSLYRFIIKTKNGETLWRNDPRSLSYPHGKYSLNSKIFDDSVFKWSEFTTPHWYEMILYEMHIGTFSEKGTFRAAVDSFDYLVNLGINTLALMPIHQDIHQHCWGYDPTSLFAIHDGFGTPEDLQFFVNEAHKKGLAVILDWVPNHMTTKNVLANFDEISSDNDGPYFYKDDKVKTDFGPKLNYSEPEVRRYIKDSARMFLECFHFDGIRVDSTGTMRRLYVGKEEQNLDAWTLIQEINDMVHTKLPGKIMIAEDLQGNRLINYSLGSFDSQWDDRFFSILFTNAIDPSDANRNLNQLADAICHSYHSYLHNRVIYTENHDTIPEDRQKRLPEAIFPGSGDKNFFAIKRSVLCCGILFTSPGIPMILQGQEILETSCPAWPNPPTVDWSRKERFKGIFDLYKQLIALRTNKLNNTKGLTSPQTSITHMNHFGKVMVYHRYQYGGPGDDVLVVINFSNTVYKEYVIGFPRDGRWNIRFNSDQSSYCSLFEDIGTKVQHIDTVMKPYDGFFFSGSLTLGRYSMLIISMDPLQ